MYTTQLPEFPWPYIIFVFSITGIFGAWTLDSVVRNISSRFDQYLTNLEEDADQAEILNSERSELIQFRNTANFRMGIHVFAMTCIGFISVLFIFFTKIVKSNQTIPIPKLVTISSECLSPLEWTLIIFLMFSVYTILLIIMTIVKASAQLYYIELPQSR